MTFTVPGDPLPKARPRFVRGHTMTDPRTMRAEQLVVMAARRAKVKPLTGPVAIWVAYYRRTKRRCDLDNLVKLTLDGLNKVAWLDDDQVVSIHATKHLDKDNPRTEVRLELAEQLVERVETAFDAFDDGLTLGIRRA